MAHQNFTGLRLHQNNKIPRLAECLSDGDFYCKVSDFFVCLFGKQTWKPNSIYFFY